MGTARRSLTVLAIVLLAACAKNYDETEPDQTNRFEPVVVEVENQNWNDVAIYAVVNGSRRRVGTVGAGNHATLKLDNGMMALPGTVQFLLDPLGSRASYRTGNIQVNFGQQIQLKVANELRLTTWTVQ